MHWEGNRWFPGPRNPSAMLCPSGDAFLHPAISSPPPRTPLQPGAATEISLGSMGLRGNHAPTCSSETELQLKKHLVGRSEP